MRAPFHLSGIVYVGSLIALRSLEDNPPQVRKEVLERYYQPEQPKPFPPPAEKFQFACIQPAPEAKLYFDPSPHRYQPWWVANETPNPKKHARNPRTSKRAVRTRQYRR